MACIARSHAHSSAAAVFIIYSPPSLPRWGRPAQLCLPACTAQPGPACPARARRTAHPRQRPPCLMAVMGRQKSKPYLERQHTTEASNMAAFRRYSRSAAA